MSQCISSTHHIDQFGTEDIGGTDFWTVGAGATAGWVSMEEYDAFLAHVWLGPNAWNAADQVDELFLQQATDAVGTGAKALTVAKNLNQAAVNTLFESFTLECRGDELDVDGGFTFVRCYVAEAGNTGQDDCTVTYIRTKCRYANDNESGATAHV
jgi:hypothetical protein